MAQEAPVVITSTNDSTEAQGTLFKNIRFFVAQRIPSRSTFLDTITRNGGTVVKLEKLSDIIIADHLRKESPPGSYSYTWIEQSVRDGQLADKEDHRAGTAQATARPVGALKSVRGSRVSYTKEDDLVLWKWVKDYERRGGKALGNEIYKQLEQKNNRHPHQSWRDRYVKHLLESPEYQRELEKILEERGASFPEPPPALPRPSQSAAAPGPPKSTLSPSAPDTPRPSQSGSAKGTRVFFTKVDDMVLWKWVSDAERKGGKVKGMEIYKRLEQKNNRHTHQSWRDRYVTYLLPNLEYQRELETMLHRNEGPAEPAPGSLKFSPSASVARTRHSGQEMQINGHTEPNPQPLATPARPRTKSPVPSRGSVAVKTPEADPAVLPERTYPVSTETESMIFTQSDVEALLIESIPISIVPEDLKESAWIDWAKSEQKGSAALWERCFEQYVAPKVDRIRRMSAERDRRYSEHLARMSGASITAANDREAPQPNGHDHRPITPVAPSSAKAQRRNIGSFGEPMVIISSPAKHMQTAGDEQERFVNDPSPRHHTRSRSSESSALKRKRNAASPADHAFRSVEDSSSPKRVRFDPLQEPAQHESHAETSKLPAPGIARAALQRDHDALASQSPSRPSTRERRTNGTNGEQIMHGDTRLPLSDPQAEDQRFDIWQGDDYVEDDKENMRESDASPVAKMTLRPDDALDAFNSDPPHFKLEAPGDGVMPIEDILSDSEDDEEEPADAEVEDERPRAPKPRALMFDNAEVIDLSTPDDLEAGEQESVSSPGPSRQQSPSRERDIEKDQVNGQAARSDSHDRYESAREDPRSDSQELQCHEVDETPALRRQSIYSDDANEEAEEPLSARHRFMYSASSDEGELDDVNRGAAQQSLPQSYKDTQALLNGDYDPGDLMGMPPLPDDSDMEAEDIHDLMGMPRPTGNLQPPEDHTPTPLPQRSSQKRPRHYTPTTQSNHKSSPPPRFNQVDTQTLLNSEPHIPDFEFPSSPPHVATPPRRRNDTFFSSPSSRRQNSSKKRRRSPSPGPLNRATPEQIETWIRKQVRQDYDEDLCVQALTMTTFNAPLAEQLLEYWRHEPEDTLPEDSRGMWSKEEDETMAGGTDARAIKKLEVWHGKRAFSERWWYMQELAKLTD